MKIKIRIRAVVANGRYFDRQTLDRLLAEAELAANSEKKESFSAQEIWSTSKKQLTYF